ncbi:hypothetical protein MJO28_005418, partial [Puccinia striiformis f. sp. tritici]
MHCSTSILLVCVLAAVGVMQHKAKGSVLHPRNIDKLQGQRNTCGARMTCYCNIKRLPGGKRVVPPRKDGTIPTQADCPKLDEKELKD